MIATSYVAWVIAQTAKPTSSIALRVLSKRRDPWEWRRRKARGVARLVIAS